MTTPAKRKQKLDGSIRIHQGDAIPLLRKLPAGLVHCCVTSPPYWALRSYLKPDDPLKELEIGSEKTPEEHVTKMVAVFAEVKSVLRDDGLLFVNYGDSYSASGNGGNPEESDFHKQKTNAGSLIASRNTPGLSALNRVGIPERFALAMQADGWIWRDTIIWHKKSPMPQSVSGTAWVKCRVKVAENILPAITDRAMMAHKRPQTNLVGHKGDFADNGIRWSDCPGCPKCEANGGYVLRRGSWRTTTAHEYIFMFAKKAGYFADHEGVKEPNSEAEYKRLQGAPVKLGGIKASTREDRPFSGIEMSGATGRNPRSVISFKMTPLSEAHYATFPLGLPDWCIRASTSPEGCCPACGSQWARVVESKAITGAIRDNSIGKGLNGLDNRVGYPRGTNESTTIGFRPTCLCPTAEPVPCTILDPFSGAGTTLIAAKRLGHNAIGLELNQDYIDIATKRIKAELGRFPLLEPPQKDTQAAMFTGVAQ